MEYHVKTALDIRIHKIWFIPLVPGDWGPGGNPPPKKKKLH